MLSKDEVLKIASLAKLTLSEEEIEVYQKNLSRVLDYVNELSSVAATGETSVRHAPDDCVGLREDIARPFAEIEALLANAPASEARSFLLPTTVEHS